MIKSYTIQTNETLNFTSESKIKEYFDAYIGNYVIIKSVTRAWFSNRYVISIETNNINDDWIINQLENGFKQGLNFSNAVVISTDSGLVSSTPGGIESIGNTIVNTTKSVYTDTKNIIPAIAVIAVAGIIFYALIIRGK